MDAPIESQIAYSAFISYSHVDAKFARRLHNSLESFRFPRRSPVPAGSAVRDERRLKPLFLDRAELNSGPDLDLALKQAIRDSAFLIVVCSPAAAASPWVNREIKYFRECHGDAQILAALIDGSPSLAFPPELLRTSDDRDIVPLASDFRPEGDGRRRALLRLVSSMAGVALDQLIRRDAQRYVRRLTAISAGSLLIAAVASALAAWALHANNVATMERERGERAIDFMITDLRSQLNSIGRLDVLARVNSAALSYYQQQELATQSKAELRRRAEILIAIGEDEEKRGNVDSALAQFTEARRSTLAALRDDPRDERSIFVHAQTEYWLGLVCWRRNESVCTNHAFQSYARHATTLRNLDARNPNWVLEAGYAASNLGAFRLRRFADHAGAKKQFEISIAHFEAAGRLRGFDREIRYELADAYGWLADCERIAGQVQEAVALRRTQRRLLEQLLKEEPRDYPARADIASNEFALARLNIAARNYRAAFAYLGRGEALVAALAREEPANKRTAATARAFELLRAMAEIKSARHAGREPTQATRGINDCEADRTRFPDAELFELCHVVRLAASSHLDHPPTGGNERGQHSQRQTASSDRLTKNWLFDLEEEARLATR